MVVIWLYWNKVTLRRGDFAYEVFLEKFELTLGYLFL